MIPALSKDELQLEDEVKIFYCSRTHSQLTQFVHELRRVDFPAPWRDIEETYAVDQISQVVIKHLPLASRKNLCINPKVAKLGNAPAINERCLELQQPEIPKDHRCPFVPNKENEALVSDFRDHTLASIRDIEDLGTLGKSIGICPYYAARSSIKLSEVCAAALTDILWANENADRHTSLPALVTKVSQRSSWHFAQGSYIGC